jgi:hypothetical protein
LQKPAVIGSAGLIFRAVCFCWNARQAPAGLTCAFRATGKSILEGEPPVLAKRDLPIFFNSDGGLVRKELGNGVRLSLGCQPVDLIGCLAVIAAGVGLNDDGIDEPQSVAFNPTIRVLAKS